MFRFGAAGWDYLGLSGTILALFFWVGTGWICTCCFVLVLADDSQQMKVAAKELELERGELWIVHKKVCCCT